MRVLIIFPLPNQETETSIWLRDPFQPHPRALWKTMREHGHYAPHATGDARVNWPKLRNHESL